MAVTCITVHPAQQPKGSKFWAHHPRKRELGEAQWLEARTDGSAPLPSYSLHDPEPENGPKYDPRDPYPIPKYRQKDPYKFHPEQQPKESKAQAQAPREFDEELFGREVFDWGDLE